MMMDAAIGFDIRYCILLLLLLLLTAI